MHWNEDGHSWKRSEELELRDELLELDEDLLLEEEDDRDDDELDAGTQTQHSPPQTPN